MGLIKYDIYDIATRHPADEFCNKMNKDDEWVITHDTEEQTYYDLEYIFYQYQKK